MRRCRAAGVGEDAHRPLVADLGGVDDDEADVLAIAGAVGEVVVAIGTRWCDRAGRRRRAPLRRRRRGRVGSLDRRSRAASEVPLASSGPSQPPDGRARNARSATRPPRASPGRLAPRPHGEHGAAVVWREREPRSLNHGLLYCRYSELRSAGFSFAAIVIGVPRFYGLFRVFLACPFVSQSRGKTVCGRSTKM